MILTSNRTRELHDALKRRCLYHWIDYPDARARGARSCARGCRACPRRVAAARVRGRRAAARARSSTSCRAWGRRSPGRARCSRSATTDLDDDARRRAEGARGHRARARAGGARGCLSRRGLRRERSPPRWRLADAARRGRARRGGRGAGRPPRAGRRRRRRPAPRPTSRCARRCARATPTSPRSTPPSPPCFAPAPARPAGDDPLDLATSAGRSVLPLVASGRRRAARAAGGPLDPRAVRRPLERRRSCCATRTSPTTRDAERGWRAACSRGSRGAARAAQPRRTRARRGAAGRRLPDLRATAARVAALRRRADRAALARARAQRRAPLVLVLRRLGLDGALRAHAAAVPRTPAWRRAGACEAFVFGTRLTRVTRELAGRDPDRALARVAAAVQRLVGRHAHRRRAGRAQPRCTAGASAAARWWWCSPTAGTAASRSSSPTRWRACRAARHGSSGSTRSRRTTGLRAAHARHAGRAAARRPLPGGQLDRLARSAGRADARRPASSNGAGADRRLVLAAGEGAPLRRRPSSSPQLDGRPLLEHALAAIAGRARHRPVVVVLGAQRRARSARGVDLLDAEPFVCDGWDEGQAASLRAGLAALGDVRRRGHHARRPAAHHARGDRRRCSTAPTAGRRPCARPTAASRATPSLLGGR